MRYKASVQLKKADTSGRVPASTLDGFIREELLRQIGTNLKPLLTIHQAPFIDSSPSTVHGDHVDFTTELIILPTDEWHEFKEQLSRWCHEQLPEEASQLQALLDALENPTNG